MKKLALLCMLIALVATGCGKKSTKTQKSKSPAKSRSIKRSKNLALKDSEDFFDNGAVSDFAFVDDETAKAQDAKTVAANDLDKKDLNKDFALASNDEEDEKIIDDNDNAYQDDAENEKLAFQTVHFDLNGNDIRADQEAIVNEDCEVAKDATAQGKKVVVRGHCCQLGSHSYNMALSQKRAETIKTEMVKNGVPEKYIKTVGYGNEMPLVWSDKKDRTSLIKELAPNRRAEVVVQ